jgi:hypothetical protein
MAVTLVLAVIPLLYLLTPLGKTARWALAVTIVLAFHALAWPTNRENYILEKHGVGTTGVVVATDCRITSTQWMAYRFSANGQDYEGKYGVGGGRTGCEGIRIGTQTFITYLKDNPAISRPVREVNSLWLTGLLLTISPEC